MRVNIYSQELITDADEIHGVITDLVAQESNTGAVYHGVRLYLHSSQRLHHPPNDDDRSAITFWLPKSKFRRELLAVSFDMLAALIREAPEETGLD